MTRKQQRNLALKLLYQMEVQKETPEHILGIAYEEQKVNSLSRAYIENIITGVASNQTQLDQLISTYSAGWSIDRIGKISLAALRLAIFEILYCSDIPDSVAINEAVDLTKLYVDDKSAGFVNGILASVLKAKNSQTETK